MLIQVSCCCDFIICSRALLSTFQLTTYIAACSSEVEHSPIIVPLLFYQAYFSYCRKSAGISAALQLMFDLQSRHVVLVTCNSTTSFNLRLPGRAWCPGVPPICCTIISLVLGYIGDSLRNSLTQS